MVFLRQELGSTGLCSGRSSPTPSGRFLLRSPAGSRQLSDLDQPWSRGQEADVPSSSPAACRPCSMTEVGLAQLLSSKTS